jgi:hypothetical protein
MAEKASPGTSLGEKTPASAKTYLGTGGGSGSPKVGQASPKVGQASPKVGQASPKVKQGEKSPAVSLAERPEDVTSLVSRVVKVGGSATVRLKGRTLQSALAKLGDQVDSISAVVTLRGNTPAK